MEPECQTERPLKPTGRCSNRTPRKMRCPNLDSRRRSLQQVDTLPCRCTRLPRPTKNSTLHEILIGLLSTLYPRCNFRDSTGVQIIVETILAIQQPPVAPYEKFNLRTNLKQKRKRTVCRMDGLPLELALFLPEGLEPNTDSSAGPASSAEGGRTRGPSDPRRLIGSSLQQSWILKPLVRPVELQAR